MTSKEKAEELLHKYRLLFINDGEDYGQEILVSILSKQCALIAVDEIINCNYKNKLYDLKYKLTTIGFDNYWQEVKQEIEKL